MPSTPASGFPDLVRRKIDSLRFKAWGALGVGVLPNLMIIGGMRCGTTSLWDHLTRHPLIRGSRTKELHFFCTQFALGERWYRANFTPRPDERVFVESSPYYLFHPLAPARAASVVPNAKLIVMVREPVDRTYSHYNQNLQLGLETLPLEAALRREAEQLPGWEADIVSGRVAYSAEHQNFSYVGKSLYAPQISRWLEHYPREQMLLLRSEDFYASPQETLARVTDFLEIDRFAFPDLGIRNGRLYERGDQPLRPELSRLFAEANRELRDRFGIGWG